MSSAPRILSVGIVLGLAAGLLVGVGVTGPGRATAPTPSASPNAPAVGPVVVAPGALPPTTSGATGVASSGTAIAYPYFGGAPGIAADHTIVVTGQGQADLKADGSNRATAQRSALAAALADARAQADAIATETHLTIGGVLSVSASVFPSFGVVPMMKSTTGSATGQPVPPQVAPEPASPSILSVSVTVAYQVS